MLDHLPRTRPRVRPRSVSPNSDGGFFRHCDDAGARTMTEVPSCRPEPECRHLP
jgi:hypothetical protein